MEEEQQSVSSRQFGGFGGFGGNFGIELLLGIAILGFLAYSVFRNVIIAVNALTTAVIANGGTLGRSFQLIHLLPGE